MNPSDLHFWSSELRLLARLARVNPDAHAQARIKDLLPAVDWERFVALAAYHGVTPLVFRNLGSMALPRAAERVPDRLRRHRLEATRWDLAHYASWRRISQGLVDEGIPAVTLKGFHTVLAVYGEVGLRPVGDLDFLVPRDAVAPAVQALQDMGFALWPRWEAALRHVGLRHVLRSTYQVALISSRGVVVDLHWEAGPKGSVPPADELLRGAERMKAGGGTALVSPLHVALALWLIHGQKSAWGRLRQLIDVAEALEKISIEEFGETQELLRRLGQEVALSNALSLLRSLGNDVPEPLRQSVPAVPAQRRLVRYSEHLLERQSDQTLLQDRGRPLRQFLHRFGRNPSAVRALGEALRPSFLDWSVLPLPRGLRWAYWMVRPLRSLWRLVPSRRAGSEIDESPASAPPRPEHLPGAEVSPETDAPGAASEPEPVSEAPSQPEPETGALPQAGAQPSPRAEVEKSPEPDAEPAYPPEPEVVQRIRERMGRSRGAPAPPPRAGATLISAAYDNGPETLIGGRGRGLDTYLPSLINLANLGWPLVFFCDPKDEETARRTLEPYFSELCVVPFALSEFEFFDAFVEWKSTYVDGLVRNDRNEVLIFLKSYWLHWVGLANPFGTRTYFWMDAGLSHHGIMPEAIGGVELRKIAAASHYYPENSKNIFRPALGRALADAVEVGRVMFCAYPMIGGTTAYEGVVARRYGPGREGLRIQDHLAGGLIGGHREVLDRFHSAFVELLEAFITQRVHTHDEQVFSALYAMHPRWFALRRFHFWQENWRSALNLPDVSEGRYFYQIFTELLREHDPEWSAAFPYADDAIPPDELGPGFQAAAAMVGGDASADSAEADQAGNPAATPSAESFRLRRAFESFGVVLGLQANDQELLDDAMERLPPGWADTKADRVETWYSVEVTNDADGVSRGCQYALRSPEATLHVGRRRAKVLEELESEIRVRVGVAAPRHLFVHAGAVAWRGVGIVLPGRSHSGKTELVAALIEAGAEYLSDEYAVFDNQGLLHPFARPLAFRQGEFRRVRRSATADLGGVEVSGPVRPGLIIHTRYEDGASWAPALLSPSNGALTLLNNTLVAQERPEFALETLSCVMATAKAFEGTRGEAAPTARAIIELVESTHAVDSGRLNEAGSA